MFTREEALALVTEKFPTKTVEQTDYVNGGTKTVTTTPEKWLDQTIDLAEPSYDGLKPNANGLDEDTEEVFRRFVLSTYKNENGLW